MTKLIALIDGSLYAQSVCDHAAWAALRGPMAIELVHVLGRRSIASAPVNLSGSIGLGARTALLSELAELDEQNAKLAHKRGRLLLDEARASLIKAGVSDVMARLRNDDIVETVQTFEGEAELIVIGKRGEAADFAKLHLGSNLERVVRASHRPVLVASRAFKPIERVLIAFDGGPSALKAVAFIAASPLFAGLACHLLCVGHDDAATRDKIETASAVLYASGHDVTAEHKQGLADEIITRTVENWRADLLVMGAYGHSRIRNLIIGSTTTQMIRACKIPVMLFR
ncbi:MAG: universal stress protein [Parvibaculum sp.]|nr:universal stress protein [Parvibaculum sp.]